MEKRIFEIDLREIIKMSDDTLHEYMDKEFFVLTGKKLLPNKPVEPTHPKYPEFDYKPIYTYPRQKVSFISVDNKKIPYFKHQSIASFSFKDVEAIDDNCAIEDSDDYFSDCYFDNFSEYLKDIFITQDAKFMKDLKQDLNIYDYKDIDKYRKLIEQHKLKCSDIRKKHEEDLKIWNNLNDLKIHIELYIYGVLAEAHKLNNNAVKLEKAEKEFRELVNDDYDKVNLLIKKQFEWRDIKKWEKWIGEESLFTESRINKNGVISY